MIALNSSFSRASEWYKWLHFCYLDRLVPLSIIKRSTSPIFCTRNNFTGNNWESFSHQRGKFVISRSTLWWSGILLCLSMTEKQNQVNYRKWFILPSQIFSLILRLIGKKQWFFFTSGRKRSTDETMAGAGYITLS